MAPPDGDGTTLSGGDGSAAPLDRVLGLEAQMKSLTDALAKLNDREEQREAAAAAERDRIAAASRAAGRTAEPGLLRGADHLSGQIQTPGERLPPFSRPTLRIPDIPRFSGEREKTRMFVSAIDRALAATGDADSLQGFNFASRHLDGSAALWFEALLQLDGSISSWRALKPHLLDNFCFINEQEVFENRLLACVQTGTVQEYVDEYLAIAMRLPHLDEAFKINRFRQGICEFLRDKLVSRDFYSLMDIMHESVKLSSKFAPEKTLPDTLASPLIAAMPARRRTGPETRPGRPTRRECYVCGSRFHLKHECPDKHRAAGNAGPPIKGSVRPGRYNGSGRVNAIEAVVASDELSDDELRSGNGQA